MKNKCRLKKEIQIDLLLLVFYVENYIKIRKEN